MINQFTEQLLAEGESARLEYRAALEPMSSIAQTVCAFLNTQGGVVLVGVDDDGEPNGSVTPAQGKRLQSFLREKITPRVVYDVATDETKNGKVISIGVPAGPDRPYVCEGAVYIRKGSKTVIANATMLRSLVEKSAQGVTRWERRPSSGLELDGINRTYLEETVRRAQERRGFQFENAKDSLSTLSQLSLIQSGQLTNASDVLFGNRVAMRHPQTRLRAVCYATDRTDKFLDEQLFEGPAFKLLEEAMAFLKRHVSISSEFPVGQLARHSKPKYPFSALREGLVNALVHRDYSSFSGSVTISIYPDRVEIWNTGRLPTGLTPRDLVHASHPSILVNPDIGHVFYLHELMERVGRGTYKIVQECRQYGIRTEWANAGAGVRLTLQSSKDGESLEVDLNPRQQKFLEKTKPGDQMRLADYLKQYGRGVSDRQARRDLSELESSGYLIRQGSGPKTTYERTERKT